MSTANNQFTFQFPDAVRVVLAERVGRLRSGQFPETNIAYAATLAQLLEGMLQNDLDRPYPHRLAADLAIVASRVAHALDRDRNSDYVFQVEFRERLWLAEQCLFLSSLLDPDSVENVMAAVQAVNPRPLTAQEKEQFIQCHITARHPNPPLLDREKMAAFLDSQKVYFLPGGTGKLRMCSLSSFDGLCIYVVDHNEDGGSTMTISHELEHNLRRYMEEDAQEQARLVAPARDPTLRITNSQGISLQCEAGFVMEDKNGRKVPDDLIGPFSARWNRRFLK